MVTLVNEINRIGKFELKELENIKSGKQLKVKYKN